MGRALQSIRSNLSQHLREKGGRFAHWVRTELLHLFVCYACGHRVNMLDRVCNQCGTGDPARLSKQFMTFLGIAAFFLIITLLWLFAF